MKKKFFLIYIIIFLTGCGYNPIYSNKDLSEINIYKIKAIGDDKINRKLLSVLNIKKSKELKDSYFLNIKTEKNKEHLAKDVQGNVTIYKISLKVTVTLNQPSKEKKKVKEFNSSFSYNNQQNKFELSREEKNIERNLIENIAEKIILFIYS